MRNNSLLSKRQVHSVRPIIIHVLFIRLNSIKSMREREQLDVGETSREQNSSTEQKRRKTYGDFFFHFCTVVSDFIGGFR